MNQPRGAQNLLFQKFVLILSRFVFNNSILLLKSLLSSSLEATTCCIGSKQLITRAFIFKFLIILM